jgi:pimeloyl-ACP methyl ester carboxylesterase
MRRRWLYREISYVFIISLLLSCNSNDPAPKDSNLVSAQSQFTRTASDLKTILGASGLNLPLTSLKYDVEVYKVVYNTDYLGESIQASALVILPKNPAGSVPMVSFQHGTISSHAEAPTALALSDEELVLYTALASPGFIAVVPDFIGFGASSSKLHPYYIESLTASAVMDALRAAKDLAGQKSISFNSKLFLAGYSQGGYATMATHKYIETEQPSGFELVASFPASGGYDIKNMQEYFFSLDAYGQPFYIAFVADAYKTTYGWTQPLTDMFNEPYASRIPGLLDGTKTSSQINAQLTENIHDLLTTDVLQNIETSQKFATIVAAFRENSLTDWTPKKPLYMYHGNADGTVPYSNSVVTYNKLVANGSTSVTLTTLEGANHSTGVIPYVELFIPKLLDLGGK